MAKKSRRGRRRRVARTTARAKSGYGAKAERKVETAGAGQATSAGFAEQYAYVYDDLKRIAILAGTFFAMLIALSFVVR